MALLHLTIGDDAGTVARRVAVADALPQILSATRHADTIIADVAFMVLENIFRHDAPELRAVASRAVQHGMVPAIAAGIHHRNDKIAVSAIDALSSLLSNSDIMDAFVPQVAAPLVAALQRREKEFVVAAASVCAKIAMSPREVSRRSLLDAGAIPALEAAAKRRRATEPASAAIALEALRAGHNSVDIVLAFAGVMVSEPPISQPPKECARCGLGPSLANSLKVCSRCRTVRYCCQLCQRDHWPTHKPLCNAASASAADP